MDSLRKTTPRPKHPLKPFILPDIPSAAFPLSEASFPQTPVRRIPFFRVLGLLGIMGLGGFIVFLGIEGAALNRNLRFENIPAPSFLSQIKNLAGSLFDPEAVRLRGQAEGRINILLLGRAGEHYPGKNLTDTVMVLSIDTADKKVALLSLPRDLYAPLPGTGSYTKINSLYQYGLNRGESIDPLRASIEYITGQRLHYFAMVDFDGFEKIVDAVGGIEVDVVRDFYDPRYPGKNYSYETFEIKKGWQTLNGKTALKYVRERHNDPEGDFGRAKRQQQVAQAIKDKVFSLGTFTNIFVINSLLSALGESVKTDMTLEEIGAFLTLSRSVDTKNISTFVVDAWKKDSLLRVSHITVSGTQAFILIPRTGNFGEIREVGRNIFTLDTLRKRREMITAERPTLAILSHPADLAVAHKLARLTKDKNGFLVADVLPLSAMDRTVKESTIQDATQLSKPYSLDELITTFGLIKAAPLPSRGTKTSDYDFVLTIGSDLLASLDFEEVSAQNTSALAEQSDFQDILEPQPVTVPR